jgi:hypothetical protein
MTRLSENPVGDLSAGHEGERDLYRLMAEPPARLEDVFDSPAIRQHIGDLIVNAIRKSEWG